MRPTHSLVLASLLTIGCEPTTILERPLEDPVDTDMETIEEAGFDRAREVLDARLEQDGDRVRPDVDQRLARELSDLSDRGCDPVAFMIATWKGLPNTFNGAVFNLDGDTGVRTTGFHAPVTNEGGTFSGRWLIPTPRDRPTAEPIGLDLPESESTDVSDENDSDVHVEDTDGTVIICTSGEHDGRETCREPTRIARTIGGAYTTDHRVVGSLTRGGALYPMQGIWDQTHENGGYALTIISACD